MPAKRNPGSGEENLQLVIGQLVEATRASSEGIKGLSIEVRHNATAIITAAKTLEIIEDAVSQLNIIVRTGNGRPSLVADAADKARLIADLDKTMTALEAEVLSLRNEIGGLSHDRSRLLGVSAVVWRFIVGVAWCVTTAIAFYAAFKGH